jgi:hypothetical protein
LQRQPTQARAQARVLFGATIFLGAFLLFQVQLIIGKHILPWFGGTSAVWTTCMLFFQLLLLAGYFYAHLLTRWQLKDQVRRHTWVLVIALAAIALTAFRWPTPILPGPAWRPPLHFEPISRLLLVLSVGVGVPYLALAPTGPLLQRWFVNTSTQSPYPLYALSNAGSLLGLWSYPFLIEPYLSLSRQAWLWSALFLVYLALCALCSRVTMQAEFISAPAATDSSAPSPSRYAFWVTLAACASMMLVSGTNMIAQEVASVPFLWVLPLSLYLLSFIVCFQNERYYQRALFQPLFALSAVLAIFLLFLGYRAGWKPQLVIFSLVIFSACMVLHGELVRLKPASTQLTRFYLAISLGGALGSIFVGLIAPFIFPAYWEFHIAIAGTALLMFVALWRDRQSWLYRGSAYTTVAIALLILLTPHLSTYFKMLRAEGLKHLGYYHALVAIAVLLVLAAFFRERGRSHESRYRVAHLMAAVWVVMIIALAIWHAHWDAEGYVSRSRNFYGVLAIFHQPDAAGRDMLVMRHGKTNHGMQYQDAQLRSFPAGYYTAGSGIGRILQSHPLRKQGRPLRMGVVGLGTGTLAAYSRPGDHIRYYELDPAVVRYSLPPRPTFTYLVDTPAGLEVVPGDGRLSLERELAAGHPGRFDVLAIDAFNSDSIPVHLLTREAVELYLAHLSDQGVLALHISNRTLDLRYIVNALAHTFQLHAVHIHSAEGDLGAQTYWVLLSRNPKTLQVPEIISGQDPNGPSVEPILWTDDYSNLFRVLK